MSSAQGASQPPAKKASSGWTLRFQARPDYASIAKFSDKVSAAELQNGGQMYYEDEELREEEEDPDIVKDAEYWAKKRRKQRRYYRRKQTIILEHQADQNSSVRYEGKMVNVEVNPEVELLKQKAPVSQDKDLFKYVLMQFVKREGQAQPEIHVIPVGDMFSFYKSSKVTDSLLTEIEDRDREDEQRKQAQLTRYKEISKGLDHLQKQKSAEFEKELQKQSTSYTTDSFSAAMLKVFSQKKESSSKVTGDQDLGDSAAGIAVVLDENGMDADEFREHDFCGGDYSSRFADDEEDQVAIEQDQLTKHTEGEISDMWRYDEGQSEEEDEDEEEEAKTAGEKPDSETADVLGGAVTLSGAESGFVSTDILKGAMEARRQIQQQKKEAERAKAHAKRPLEGADGDMAAKRVRFPDEAAAAPGSPSSSAAAGPTPSPAAPSGRAGEALALTENSVRKYLEHRGGKVSLSELTEVFKPVMKAYAKGMANKAAGRDRMLQILDGLVDHTDDPLLGNAVVLRRK